MPKSADLLIREAKTRSLDQNYSSSYLLLLVGLHYFDLSSINF
jgi:hypothetical protein